MNIGSDSNTENATESAVDDSLDTRNRLLFTALRLYAREGIESVSLRRISAAAGSKNSAAMHYHFTNKLGILEALVEMIARELLQIDTTLQLENGPPKSLHEACFGTVKPLAVLARTRPWGYDALRFMSLIVSENKKEVADIVKRIYETFWNRVDTGLARLLPDLPPDIRRLRLMFMSVNVIHGVASAGLLAYTPLGDLSHFDDDALLNQLVDYMTAGLQAPISA